MYFNYLLIVLLCCIVLIVILFLVLKKKKKLIEKLIFEKHDLEVLRKGELKDYFKEEWKKGEEYLQNELEHYKKEIELRQTSYVKDFELRMTACGAELQKVETLLKEKEARYEEVNQDLDLYREGKIKEIDGTAAEYEQRKRQSVDNSIDRYRKIKNQDFENFLSDLQRRIDLQQQEYEAIKKDLEVERSKRAAINEEIRRQREVEMKQDFYRIQFGEEDKNDVEILRSVAPRLKHPEAINKVIWSAYYQKPLAELRKRVAIEGSGIYKITRIKTGEIYIGQARNVSTRFAEHCKAALGVGTLASSQLHRVMQSDGCENFLFELLEEVPVEKLKERESYYIDFYDSKNYGLNTIRGEQK